jgi:hypothetical protein
MNEKEYPADENYDKYAEQLLDFIDTRDRVLAAMKDMTPEQRREAQEPLKVLNESIEKIEEHLAEYDKARRKERRAEERENELADDVWRRMLIMYVFVKQRMPEKLDEFTKNLENFSPEVKEEFLDQAAIMETYDPDDLLAEYNS